MIGQATASLHPPARRLLQRVWGAPNIDTRQKWTAVWPIIARLPRSPLRILDAGCGDGVWTLEIAAHRPQWLLVGIDRDAEQIAGAVVSARELALHNAQFVTTDFLQVRSDRPFRCRAHGSVGPLPCSSGQWTGALREIRGLAHPRRPADSLRSPTIGGSSGTSPASAALCQARAVLGRTTNRAVSVRRATRRDTRRSGTASGNHRKTNRTTGGQFARPEDVRIPPSTDPVGARSSCAQTWRAGTLFVARPGRP